MVSWGVSNLWVDAIDLTVIGPLLWINESAVFVSSISTFVSEQSYNEMFVVLMKRGQGFLESQMAD